MSLTLRASRGWRRWWSLCLWAAWGLLPGLPAQAAVLVIDQAWARLQPEGGTALEGPVSLNRRWDLDFPGRGGAAAYRVALPPGQRADMALLVTRVGSQAEFRLNGVLLRRLGTLGQADTDASKSPLLLQLPPALLRAEGPNTLTVDVTVQRQRWGGLSLLQYGPEPELRPRYDTLQTWRHVFSEVFAACLAIMGGLSALLWWRQREALYGVFALAAWLGMVRNLDQGMEAPWLPWPWWGAVVAASYAAHLALICQFTLMALGRMSRAMHWGVGGVLLASVGLALASFAWADPILWTLGLATLVPLGVITVLIVADEAWRSRSTIALVLAGAGVLAVAAGVHDLLWVRSVHSNGLQVTWMPVAIFLFALIMAGMVADRFSGSVAALRGLSEALSARVAQREGELRAAFEQLEAQQRRQAVTEERQRIMRELHDGVGAHLVGLMHLVQRPEIDRLEVEVLARTALDDMRVAVDSLQSVEGDLTMVLAMLRHRLEPRLRVAGLALVWEMGDLPPRDEISPQSVLHVQRIVLEAVTNVIRHAQATQVAIRVRCDAAGTVDLEVVDDGVGPGRAEGGLGLRNMRSRARSLGAELRIEAASPRGTRVHLRWPLAAA